MPTISCPTARTIDVPPTARTIDVPPTARPETHSPADPETDQPIDPDRAEVTLDTPGSAATPVPTRGTGVRNGLVRTPTVRSNTCRALLNLREDRGAATAEYIVATMAAVGFAGLLIVILRGDEVRGILTELVRSALSVG
jgi:hypothetical protein